jgi:hypothetical protein
MALNIIGVGMGRTGTASLKVALEQLGLGNCYHMTEVMQHPESIQDWIDAADGNPDWDKIFDNYTATVDNPGCGFWQELTDYYPNAKVILTVRDAERWFDSTNETIHAAEIASFIKSGPWGEMVQRTVYDTMDNRMQDKDFMVSWFNQRNEGIINSIKPERLLVYEVKTGWGPLCEFLDVSVPDTDFPNINSRDETKQLFANLMNESGEQLNDEAMGDAARGLHPE